MESNFIQDLESKQKTMDHADVIVWIRDQIPVNKINKAIAEEYLTDNCIAVVLDSKHPTTSEFVELSYVAMKCTGTLLIFRDKYTSKFLPINTAIISRDVVILNPRYYIDILLQIKSHIVTGSSWSWWMAISATNTSVPAIYPMGYSQSYIDRSISVSYDWSYSLWFDHVYYINLAKRTDRRQKMEDQLHKWHLHATRIEAVDGATIKWSIANGVSNKYWNNGALGLCLSFNKVLDDAIANGYNKILILEDDAILTDNFVSVLNVAWKALPNEWRMLYLGANHAGNIPTQDISSSLYRLISSFGSHAMILNRTCFQHFRRFLSAPYGPLDVYFSVYHKFYPCYITYPGVAYQDIGFSDILEKNTDYGKNIDYIDWKKQFQHPLQS